MHRLILRPRVLGFVVGTRAMLAFGAGLLAASHIPEERRRRLGLALVGLGLATTIPAARMVFKSRGAQTFEFRANGHRTDIGLKRA